MKIPIHLNALRAFEASARHQSFSSAAEELNVTPAAVGQLVRTLEDWLGVPLFHRSASGRLRLVPTEVAERALPEIRAGFDRLTLGMERLKEGSANGLLTVTVSPAFAAKWLLPRIDRFQSLWPDTDVRLDTSLKPVDFVAQRIDIGVRYGSGSWPGLVAEKLMDEEMYPVCTPAVARQYAHRRNVNDVAQATLIHDVSLDGHTGFPNWDSWLEHAGVVERSRKRGLRINNSAAVLQAVLEGRGIALARSVMAHDDVVSGRLVRIFPHIRFPSPLSYYVVYRHESASLPRLAGFRAWLQEEVRVPR